MKSLAHAEHNRSLCIVIFLIELLLILSLPMLIFAQNGGGATAFLLRPVGGEAISMGGAYAAIASDPSAMIWNPAGIGMSPRYKAMFTYSILPLDQQHNFAGVSIPVYPGLTIGGGWINYGVDGIDGRDDAGAKLGKFSSSDNAFILSVARQFAFQNRGSMSVGISGKYLYSSVAEFAASGMGFDIGVLFKYERFSLGAAVQNMGAALEWKNGLSRTDRIPFTFRGGIAYDFNMNPYQANRPGGPGLRISMEGAKTQNRDAVFLAGVEGRLSLGMNNSTIALRGGYGNSLFAAGLGIITTLDRTVAVELQYAASEDFLTDNLLHHIGIVLQF